MWLPRSTRGCRGRSNHLHIHVTQEFLLLFHRGSFPPSLQTQYAYSDALAWSQLHTKPSYPPAFSLSNSSISTPYSHRQSLTRPPILSHALFSLPIVAPPPAHNPGSYQPIIRRFPADPRCLHSPATFHCCRLHQAGKGLKKRRDGTRSINPSPFDPSAAVGSFGFLYSVLCQHSSPRHLLD